MPLPISKLILISVLNQNDVQVSNRKKRSTDFDFVTKHLLITFHDQASAAKYVFILRRRMTLESAQVT
jgi:hypothetical protein